MGKKLLFGLLAVAVALGFKFWNKSSSHDAVKTRLVQLCEGDAGCQRAVDQHFEGCFESSFKLGGRRTASHLETEQLVKCLNERSGTPHFAVAAEETKP